MQGIVPKSVTHHPGLFVTYPSGSNHANRIFVQKLYFA